MRRVLLNTRMLFGFAAITTLLAVVMWPRPGVVDVATAPAARSW